MNWTKIVRAAAVAAALVAAIVSARDAFADPLRPLHAQGTQIVDSSGHPVVLRGINLGGWLVEEPWMQPFVTTPPAGSGLPRVQDHVSLWQLLKSRFGEVGMERARNAFRDAWLSEADFGRIHDAGLNCVRLPFLASLADEPGGLERLDQAVGWAGAHGIYVVLDMHGVPGSQSDQDHTGQAGVNQFFHSPSDIAAAADLWTRLARRYRGNPAVAGYDLVNEPTGTPNSDTLYVVEDRLYRAVRAGDPDHLIFIEDGYTGVQWMPYPIPCGWSNVVYSWHAYQFHAQTPADHVQAVNDSITGIVKVMQSRPVPFYVGEFNLEPHGSGDAVASVINAFDANGISWSMWTYKVMYKGGGQSLWGLYENPNPVVPLDPYTDSLADWIRQCAQVRTEKLTANPGLLQAFQQSAGTH